jgi:hypothetical protein
VVGLGIVARLAAHIRIARSSASLAESRWLPGAKGLFFSAKQDKIWKESVCAARGDGLGRSVGNDLAHVEAAMLGASVLSNKGHACIASRAK